MEITLKNLQKKVLIPRARLLKAAKAAFRELEKRGHFKASPFLGLSIVFVGTRRMRAINKKYLGHDYVTDVLTFDLGGGSGEIIICPQIACVNARSHQTSTEKEIILYAVHGILHLAGFNDHDPKDMARMRSMEKELA
jgi:probable rRNA maturation factor